MQFVMSDHYNVQRVVQLISCDESLMIVPAVCVHVCVRSCMQARCAACYLTVDTVFDLISVLFAYVILGQKNRPN